MTTPHRTLQMALDALDAITDDVDGTGLNTMPSFDKAIDAIAALREALAPDHLRDTTEKAAPAAPVVPLTDEQIDSVIRDVAELDYSSPEGMPDVMLVTADELRGILQARLCEALAAPPAAPAPAQPVPLTQDQIADCTRTAHRACDAKGPMTRWSTEFARAIEAAHGITGGSK